MLSVSPISFCAKRPQGPDDFNKNRRPNNERPSDNSRRGDSFEKRDSRPTPPTKAPSKTPNKAALFLAALAATAAIGIGIAGCGSGEKRPSKETFQIEGEPVAYVEQLANDYQTDVGFILKYNGLSTVAELEGKEEISIPSVYSYLDDNIAELSEKIESGKLKGSKKTEAEGALEALLNKKEEQDETAAVLSDGKMIYYIIKKDGGINVESFKNLFDIKDGYIKSYNKISSVWKVDGDYDPLTNDGYFDYTGYRIKEGDVIKVPMRAVED